MVHFIKIGDLVEKIEPLELVKHLENTGWRHVPRERTDIRVFQKEQEGILFQVSIPLSRELRDYKMALLWVIETIARAERILPEQFVSKMLKLDNEEKEIVFIVR